MLSISKLSLLTPILNLVTIVNKSKEKTITNLIVFDNLVCIFCIFIFFLTKNMFLLTSFIYLYTFMLYVKVIKKEEANNINYFGILLVFIASLISIIVVSLFSYISILLLVYAINFIYPFMMNLFNANINFCYLLAILILIIVRSFLLISLVRITSDINIKANKCLLKYILMPLLVFSSIYYTYNYYNTNNIFKYMLVTNKISPNKEFNYVDGRIINDNSTYSQFDITKVLVQRNNIDLFSDDEINSYELNIIQQVEYNNKIYELKINYNYFYVKRSNNDMYNIDDYNTLYVNLESNDKNIDIDNQEIKDILDLGLEKINNNILNEMYKHKSRFNPNYLGNFNEITTEVNKNENKELYILINNIV